jgi:hypothetical protein
VHDRLPGAWRLRVHQLHVETIDAQRARDILQFLFTQILSVERNIAGNIFVNTRRDADAARLGERLQPRRYVDSGAKEVSLLHDDIALMNCHPQL